MTAIIRIRRVVALFPARVRGTAGNITQVLAAIASGEQIVSVVGAIVTAPFFNFIQSSPALSWVINHNLGFFPSVELFSVGGIGIEASVQHTTANQTQVSFNSATAGSARLN